MDDDKIQVTFIFPVAEELRNYIDEKLVEKKNLSLNYAKDEEEIIRYAPDTDIMVGWRPKLEYLEAANRLKLFIQPGTGAESLVKRFEKFRRKDEVITTNTHRNAYNCAQHSVTLLMGIMSKMIIHHERMKLQESSQREPTTTLLKGKMVGLLGYGPINQFVHKFVSGFDVEFSILKRNWSPSDENLPNSVTPNEKYTTHQLREFLEAVDILMIALPLTKETENLIGKVELDKLGPDGYLVNVGRGKVMNEQALFNALKNRDIAGAGLDVWNATEIDGKRIRYAKNHPFHELDNVILSPHRANSGGDITRWDPVLINIIKFADGQTDFENVIDIEKGY